MQWRPLFRHIQPFEALIRLRMPSKPRVLWIGAICINQDDLAQQVDLMGDIYRGAGRMVVWLGSGISPLDAGERSRDRTGGSSEALGFQTFERVVRRTVKLMEGGCWVEADREDWVKDSLRNSVSDGWRSCGKRGDSSSVAPVPKFGTGAGKSREPIVLDGDEMKAVEEVLSQQWWTRSWVVQEICLASEAVVAWRDVLLD
ncbi:heterokaryon incompatibility [Schizothecium vesticola]|uniref:Heterokaryon incompatibility n=1 Tax=Schizothecium vesticola TaxID=314040 RepID=A0AA40K2K6_9PEZI|nr:heterokaryon incompatibility [Schizothecium vesticola]